MFGSGARGAFGGLRSLLCPRSQVFKVKLLLLYRDGNVVFFLLDVVEGIEREAAAAAYRIGGIRFSATRTVFGKNAQRTATYRRPEGLLIATCTRLPRANQQLLCQEPVKYGLFD